MYNETPQQAARRLSAKLIQRGFKPIALHVYEDANGSSLYWRIRLNYSHGINKTTKGNFWENGNSRA